MTDHPRVAITGANGFLGRHTLQTAIGAGWACVAVVRRPDAARQAEALGAHAVVIPRLEARALAEAITGCAAVIHVAGIARVTDASFEDVNVGGVRAVLEAAQSAHVARVITPSGLGAHLAGKAAWANNDYFRSKKRVEEVVLAAPVPSVIFRPSYILGPGDELIPNLVRALRDGVVRIAGDGKVPMQPVDVDDAAAAFLAAASGKGRDRSVIDLVGPEVVDMLGLVDRVRAAMLEAHAAIPATRFEPIPWERAPSELGLSPEEIDVMRSDYLGDSEMGPRELGYRLSPLTAAVRKAVAAELGNA